MNQWQHDDDITAIVPLTWFGMLTTRPFYRPGLEGETINIMQFIEMYLLVNKMVKYAIDITPKPQISKDHRNKLHSIDGALIRKRLQESSLGYLVHQYQMILQITKMKNNDRVVQCTGDLNND